SVAHPRRELRAPKRGGGGRNEHESNGKGTGPRPYSLDDTSGHARGSPNRTKQFRFFVDRRRFSAMSSSAQLHWHGSRAGGKGRRLHDLRVAQNEAAHP